MKPQDEFAVIVAGVVSANTFELIGITGAVAASFGANIGDNALTFYHYDIATPGLTSSLRWTQGQNGFEDVALTGPRSQSGVNIDPQVKLENFTTGGAGSAATIGVGSRASLVLAESTTIPAGNANLSVAGGDITINDGTGESIQLLGGSNRLNLNSTGGGTIEMAATGGGSAAIVRGDFYALLRRGTTGPFAQAINSDVYLVPVAAGRVYYTSRPTYACLGTQQYNLPGNLNVGYRSFIMNGIGTMTGLVGDQYVITATMRILCSVVGGAFIAEYQGFGGGAGISAQRLVGTGTWTAGEDHTLTASWLFNQTVAGPITWTIVGGQTGGTWFIIAPDTWFTVTHYGIR